MCAAGLETQASQARPWSGHACTAQHAHRSMHTWMELPSAMPMDRSILFLAATNTACHGDGTEQGGHMGEAWGAS